MQPRKTKDAVAFELAVVTPDTVVPWSTTKLRARACWMIAKRAAADNVGDVCVGIAASVDYNQHHEMLLHPGDYWEMPIGGDGWIDLSRWGIDAETAADGVVGHYIPE